MSKPFALLRAQKNEQRCMETARRALKRVVNKEVSGEPLRGWYRWVALDGTEICRMYITEMYATHARNEAVRGTFYSSQDVYCERLVYITCVNSSAHTYNHSSSGALYAESSRRIGLCCLCQYNGVIPSNIKDCPAPKAVEKGY